MGSSPYGRVSSRFSWDRKPKQFSKFGKFEPKRLSFGLLAFCSFILLTFFSVSKFFSPSPPLSADNTDSVVLIESALRHTLDEQTENLRSQLEEIGVRTEKTGNYSINVEEKTSSLDSDTTHFESEVEKDKIQDNLGLESNSVNSVNTQEIVISKEEPNSNILQEIEVEKDKIENNLSLEVDSLNKQEIVSSNEESNTLQERETSPEEVSHLENRNGGETVENIINLIRLEQQLNSSSEESSIDIPQLGENIEITDPQNTLTCDEKSIDDGFPYARPVICEMSGEIAINPSKSLVTLISSPNQGYEEKHIRPYARRDEYLLPKVKEITLKPVFNNFETRQCTVTHKVPAVIFSLSDYNKNFFHDVADVLIPLFLTSYKFKGEVQFFVTDYKQWWIQKYRPILRRLSRHNIINFDRDKNVHCVEHAFLGLFRDRDLILHSHPTRNPNNYTMLDFTRFLHRVYGLKHSAPIVLGDASNVKPRLLIVSRTGTRKILNINKLVRMSKELGFEVVVSEARGNMKKFAQLVNSCDVMLAVHGAGLTNQIFLPIDAVLIQVVPWGKMDWMAKNFYGQPAKEMRLKYLEYYVNKEESSLIKRYPKDHIVFRDPFAIHVQGWDALANVIMSQDVGLNLGRFKDTLLSALDLLQD
ncbi:hypothetical protein LUZ60_009845 [Juncus effusus]|nr:hypothetical protein LUZ60_009845 [Juncus effusus]